MKKEVACGCIIFDKNNNILLIHQKNDDFWGFPKGHVDDGETEFQTALREVKEEVGLDVEIIDAKYRYVLNYWIQKRNVDKTTILYLAKPKQENANVIIQEAEVTESKWVTIEEATKLLTYDDLKEVMRTAEKDIREINPN
ncbi:MAG: NUDIX domain-containing protein [Clostridia bacterium]|nr:NUDIX domain-containing protein [Clostridia bacterium]